MSHSAANVKGALLDLLTYILLQNIKKLEGGPFGDIKKFSKKSRILLQNIKKLEGGPFGDIKKFSKKSRKVPKKNW